MKASLGRRARRFSKELRLRQLRNTSINFVLVLIALLCAAIAIILGIYDQGRIAACAGVGVGALITLDRAFGFGAMSDFLTARLVEAEILMERIAETSDEKILKRISSELRALKQTVARSAPLGHKMAAIVSFYGNYYPAKSPSTMPQPGKKAKTHPKSKRGSKKKS